MPGTVHHPDATFTGAATIGRRRLEFTDGTAVLQGPPAPWRRGGYRVTPGAQQERLEDFTVPRLRELAAEQGVDLTGARTKDDIVEAFAEGRTGLSTDADDQDA